MAVLCNTSASSSHQLSSAIHHVIIVLRLDNSESLSNARHATVSNLCLACGFDWGFVHKASCQPAHNLSTNNADLIALSYEGLWIDLGPPSCHNAAINVITLPFKTWSHELRRELWAGLADYEILKCIHYQPEKDINLQALLAPLLAVMPHGKFMNYVRPGETWSQYALREYYIDCQWRGTDSIFICSVTIHLCLVLWFGT